MSDGEDERWLVEAAQQNPLQFAALYERHVDRVFAFVLARVRNRHAAEDLTADVFHKALANLRAFEWRGAPFGAWLIRIAANCVADRHRHAAREARQAAFDAAHALEAPEALDALDRFEDHSRLFRYVDELPEIQRTVIVERFAHECSLRDVAAKLGKTEGAIKQIQLRALRALRIRMEGGHA